MNRTSGNGVPVFGIYQKLSFLMRPLYSIAEAITFLHSCLVAYIDANPQRDFTSVSLQYMTEVLNACQQAFYEITLGSITQPMDTSNSVYAWLAAVYFILGLSLAETEQLSPTFAVENPLLFRRICILLNENMHTTSYLSYFIHPNSVRLSVDEEWFDRKRKMIQKYLCCRAVGVGISRLSSEERDFYEECLRLLMRSPASDDAEARRDVERLPSVAVSPPSSVSSSPLASSPPSSLPHLVPTPEPTPVSLQFPDSPSASRFVLSLTPPPPDASLLSSGSSSPHRSPIQSIAED